jgi:hypothetical protein
LVAYTTVSNTLTIVGTVDGSTLPLIIFCAPTFVLSCSLFTLELEAPPSSTLFFLLQAFFGEFVTTFFLFSSVVYIFSLILLTFARGLCGFSFEAQINIERFLAIPKQIDKYLSYPL